jgi:site-specific recombinase XerD
VEDLLARHKASTARIRFAAARWFFGWCVDEGEVRESPMTRMTQPKVPERMTDIPTEDELDRLLASMSA